MGHRRDVAAAESREGKVMILPTIAIILTTYIAVNINNVKPSRCDCAEVRCEKKLEKK